MKNSRGSLPFRYRLTLWYILVFTISLLGFEALSYVEFRADLFAQIDAGLLSALNQAVQNIDIENNKLAFQNANESALKPLVTVNNPYSVRIIDQRGAILDAMKEFPKILSTPRLSTGRASNSAYEFQNVVSGGIRYRIATAEFAVPGTSVKNFIQVATSLLETEGQLTRFLLRFSLALPFVLIVAMLGGLFLAWRALKPIVAMEKLAARVREDRLSDRLNYQGARDEIGKLAATFDAMLDRLESSFTREKRFSADASHELRTPLTALKGKMEVALSRARSANEYEASLASMKEDVERLITLSADLLLLSKAERADFASRLEELEVGELVDSCLDQIIDANPEKRITIDRNYESKLTVRGARDYLIRLFLNILDNSVKFSDDDVSIAVSIKRKEIRDDSFQSTRNAEREGGVIIEISDKGCGIPQDEIPKLFNPFYRVESDRSRVRGGAGLGLAICGEIVEAHGGEMRVQSALGAGTTVSVTLPSVANRTLISRTS